MTSARYVYWQDGEMWLGYLEEYPDYQTQGESLEDLREQLKDLLTDGEVRIVRYRKNRNEPLPAQAITTRRPKRIS